MNFEQGYIYHIYNQGNNRQKIFFKRDNYLYFLQKIRTFVLPYADILAWCLMPNHFHLLVLVREVSIPVLEARASLKANPLLSKERTLNQSIGIMLRSYTIAINKQENRTGTLFRKQTKAQCINCLEELSPPYSIINGVTSISQKDYPQVCFEYIHNNPVKAMMAEKPEDWEFSSAKDYLGLRKGNLINRNIAEQYIDFSREGFD